jgi:hypothetical protein
MSAIDPTVPVYGFPTTASVRGNFQTAHDEITTLQAAVTALQAATANGPFLPIVGGEITGNLQVDGALNVGTAGGAGFTFDVAGSGRFSGPLSVGLDTATSAASNITINGAVGAQRQLLFRTASLTRWSFFADTSAESGANAGSNLIIGAFNDAGAYAGPLIVGNRATRVVTISASLGNTTLGQDTGITAQFTLNGPAGLGKQILFRSASSSRWIMQATATAESGGNVGSDFNLFRYDDTGTSLGSAFSIIRSTGATTIPGALTLSNGGSFAGTFSGTHTYSGPVTFAGAVTMSAGLSLGNTLAPGGVTDLSRGIALFQNLYGFNVTSSRLNIVSPSSSAVMVNIGGTDVATFNSSGITANTITPAQGTDNTALASTAFVTRFSQGYGSVAISDADTVLTMAQASIRNLVITGTTTADRNITLPTTGNQRCWVIGNGTTGGFNIIVGFGSGATFTIPVGARMEIFWTTAAAAALHTMVGPALRIGDTTRNAFNFASGTGTAGIATLGLSGTGGLQFATMPLGFNAATPIAKPTVTGAKAGNTALASLCAALVSYGLIADTSSA